MNQLLSPALRFFDLYGHLPTVWDRIRAQSTDHMPAMTREDVHWLDGFFTHLKLNAGAVTESSCALFEHLPSAERGNPFDFLLEKSPLVSQGPAGAGSTVEILLAWARAGMPQVVTSERLAAAFACGTPPPQAEAPLVWPAVCVQLPGVLPGNTIVYWHPNSTAMMLLCETPVGPFEFSAQRSVWDSIAAREDYETETNLVEPDPDQVVNPLSERLPLIVRGVFNALAAFQYTPDRISRPGKAHSQADPAAYAREHQKTLTFVVGADIKVDSRPVLREILAGRMRSFRVNSWYTRGHWRQQACGKGRQEHRTVWIDAHINNRGAPLLVRAHVLSKDPKPA